MSAFASVWASTGLSASARPRQMSKCLSVFDIPENLSYTAISDDVGVSHGILRTFRSPLISREFFSMDRKCLETIYSVTCFGLPIFSKIVSRNPCWSSGSFVRNKLTKLCKTEKLEFKGLAAAWLAYYSTNSARTAGNLSPSSC